MIKNSFHFLEGLSIKSEKNIWKQNILTWSDFIKAEKINGISTKRKTFYNIQLLKAAKAIRDNNSSHFKDIKETWRLYNYFKDEAVFLDIESIGRNRITIIGLSDGYENKTFVAGKNLDKNSLKLILTNFKLIITFNGGSYDIPIIKNYFSDVFPKVPHIDLKHLCNRLGLKGGLKLVEKELGIERPNIVKDMYGGDPALLWRKWLATGDEYFLNLLIQYNEEDTLNLKVVADNIIKQLWTNRLHNTYNYI